MPRVVVQQEFLCAAVTATGAPLPNAFSKDTRLVRGRLSPPTCAGGAACTTTEVAVPRTASRRVWAFSGDVLIKDFSAAAAEYIQGRLCSDTQQPPATPGSFLSLVVPPVSLDAYVARFVQWTGSAPCVVIALALLSRLRAMVTPLTAHRMLLGAFVLAVKLHEESFHPLAYYALMGGVNGSNLRQIERDMYAALDFSCLVSPEEFRGMVNGLRRLYPKTKGCAPLGDDDIPTEVAWDALLPPMA